MAPSTCCSPERQVACCEPHDKDECCAGDDTRCECGVGQANYEYSESA